MLWRYALQDDSSELDDSQIYPEQRQLFTNDICSKEKAYLAIVITVLPLWAILTTLIVFVLLSFHKNLRATKVYDNCTKLTALYTYYVEVRTGDTSASYNRRRTTLTIDMFDDNQTTLARIAVPGHVIFGRKEIPIGVIDDEKYFELRVTRFWLYRATRLKKVSTIRLTHNCLESDARIMVYGVEIRTNERDRHKLFFPVMNYISAYGSANKPNACFDLEPLGTISVMGGSQSETSIVSGQLTWVDYTILTYLAGALIFYFNTMIIFSNSFTEILPCVYKGLLVGCVSYVIVFLVGLLLRYFFKHYYSIKLGMGFWSMVYYGACLAILFAATILWVVTTIISYKSLCPDSYSLWVLAISISIMLAVAMGIISLLLAWITLLILPRSPEQYVLPDEISQEPASKSRNYRNLKQQQMMAQPAWNLPGTNQPPMQMVTQTGQNYPQQPPMNMYSQPLMMNPTMMQTPTSYKTLQTTYVPNEHLNLPHQSPIQAHQAHPNQQATTNQVNLQGFKAVKKVGSSESTGSTYYQQLMKNKGGVKSISQYGELLKQKKVTKHKDK